MAAQLDVNAQMNQVVERYPGFRRVTQDSRPAIECNIKARYRSNDEHVRIIIQPDARNLQTPRCWCPGIGKLEEAINSELFDMKYRKEWTASTSTLIELVDAVSEALYSKDLFSQQPNPKWAFLANASRGVDSSDSWSLQTSSAAATGSESSHRHTSFAPSALVTSPLTRVNGAASLPSSANPHVSQSSQHQPLFPRSKTELITGGDRRPLIGNFPHGSTVVSGNRQFTGGPLHLIETPSTSGQSSSARLTSPTSGSRITGLGEANPVQPRIQQSQDAHEQSSFYTHEVPLPSHEPRILSGREAPSFSSREASSLNAREQPSFYTHEAPLQSHEPRIVSSREAPSLNAHETPLHNAHEVPSLSGHQALSFNGYEQALRPSLLGPIEAPPTRNSELPMNGSTSLPVNGSVASSSSQKELDGLRERVTQLESELREKESQLAKKENDRRRSQTLQEDLQAECDRNHKELLRRGRDMQRLQQRLAETTDANEQQLRRDREERSTLREEHQQEIMRLTDTNRRLQEQLTEAMGSLESKGGGSDRNKDLKIQALQSQLQQDRLRASELQRSLEQSESDRKALAQELHEQKISIERLTAQLTCMEWEYSGLPDSLELLSMSSYTNESLGYVRPVSMPPSAGSPLIRDFSILPAPADQDRVRMYQVQAQQANQERQEVYVLFTTKVADYDIVRMIDHGCEGAVYLVCCNHSRLPDPSKRYALKVMFNIFQHGSMTQVRKQFQTEYDILAVLPPNRNIVRLYAFFFDRMGNHFPGLPPEVSERARSMSLFLVMEYHPSTLADACLQAREHNRLAFEQLVNWSYQLSEAALFLSHHKVIHRDMKLNNVLVSRDNVLKVCDFGLAVVADTPELKVHYYPNMPAGGNPAHLAPEVLLATTGRNPSEYVSYAKQCVWELGVLIHEMVTGNSPFHTLDSDQLGYSRADLPELPLDSLARTGSVDNSSGKRELQLLVKQMLEFEPQLRPPIKEIHAALTSLNTRFSSPPQAALLHGPVSLPNGLQ